MKPHCRRAARRLAVGAFTLAAAGACETGTEPRTTNPLTPILTQLSFGDWNNYSPLLSGLSFVVRFPFPPFEASVCQLTTSDGSFACPTIVQADGMSYAYKYFLIDADGAPMDRYSASTTAGVRTVVDVFGKELGAVVAHHHAELTLLGLSGSRPRTVTGTAIDHDTVFIAGNPFVEDATTTTSMSFNPATSFYPTSGTITIDAVQTATSGGAASTLPEQTIVTFGPNATATLTASVSGRLMSTCVISLINLASGVVPTCN